MAEIERLPGDGCRYYVLGRCLYEEALNPGYDTDFQCALLRWIEGRYDDFLERAEAFRLDMKTAGSVWNERFARLARKGINCPFDRFRCGGAFYDCPGYFDGLCLNAMPVCAGRCRRFQRTEPEGHTEP